ncbi:MAG: YciI family protein [Balneola sp.]
MKNLSLFILLILFASGLKAQDSTFTKTNTPETFEYNWEGTDYTMQKYFIVFLKEGPTRNQSEEDASKIQRLHLAYLADLYKKEIIVLNGPGGDGGTIKGFSLYAVATKEEAIKLASKDPAVKAGRLIVEVLPWWLAKGSVVK